jgi:hypothetical protein
MKEKKFTDGPWEVNYKRTRGEFVTETHIVSKDKSHIALVSPCAIEANAQLIATAPELLEALETMLLVVGLTAFKHEGQRKVLQDSCDVASATIDKAYGGSQ